MGSASDKNSVELFMGAFFGATLIQVYQYLQVLAMPFEKNHEFRYLPMESKSLDPKPLTLKLRPGIRDKVRLIPNWQSELRDVIEAWLQQKLEPDD